MESKKHRSKCCDRLLCALAKEPEWQRYNWFLGYMYFREKRMEAAIDHLSIAAKSESELFPVECLNARMVLAQIFATEGRDTELAETLAQALAFHNKVGDDFEVGINFRMRPWFEQAQEDQKKGRLGAILTIPHLGYKCGWPVSGVGR